MGKIRRLNLNEIFEPYVLALGKVAHAWNYLQEALALLFCTITGMDESIALAIWHSTTNDRTQREMLRAAIGASIDDRWSRLPSDDVLGTHRGDDVAPSIWLYVGGIDSAGIKRRTQ